MPRKIRRACDRQIALLQLLLDDLPPAELDLAVDGANLLAVQPDVGQLREAAAALLLENLGQLLGLRLLVCHGQDVADGAGGAEAGVGDQAPGELVEALPDLGCEDMLVSVVKCVEKENKSPM